MTEITVKQCIDCKGIFGCMAVRRDQNIIDCDKNCGDKKDFCPTRNMSEEEIKKSDKFNKAFGICDCCKGNRGQSNRLLPVEK